ncbi:MAG: PilZ domain-containing protein [Sphingobium sp.]|nr:PilZ domain-containing protein [Sphingobium sp.]
MHVQRQAKRIEVDIPVAIVTVLETTEGSIVDLTEQGAQIHGLGLPSGTRFQIEYRGQTIFALCRWSEIDRMGVKFLFELVDGPLHERLMMARMAQPVDDMPAGMPAMASAPAPLAARTFGRATLGGSFGRRG